MSTVQSTQVMAQGKPELGGAIEMQKNRIQKTAIEQVRRTLESTPGPPVEGVTRMEAIRMLAPQIQSAKSKGYSVEAIATLLSDCGVSVTAGTLRSYLSLIKTSEGKRERRKQRREPVRARSNSKAESASATDGALPPPVREDAQPPSAGKETLKPALAIATAKGTERPSEDAAHRRSTFVPREDTEDI